jgi:hypothetical protein
MHLIDTLLLVCTSDSEMRAVSAVLHVNYVNVANGDVAQIAGPPSKLDDERSFVFHTTTS